MPCLRVIIALVLVASASASAVAEEPTLEALQAEAGRLHQEYEYRAAEGVLRRILARDPKQVEARLSLATVLGAVGEGRTALELAQAVHAAHPQQPEPCGMLGFLAMGASDLEVAAAWFDKALARNPKDASSMRGLAWLAMRRADMETADRELKRAEAISPDVTGVLLMRGTWLFRTGEKDAGVRLFMRVLEREPWNLRVNAIAAGGMVLKGRPLYRAPWTPVPYRRKIKKAAKLYRAGAFEEAEQYFARLDTDDAYDGRPPFFRGLIALRTGRTRPAIEHLKRAVEREPENFLFRNGYVRAVDMHVAHQRAEHGGGAEGIDRIGPLAALVFQEPEIPGIERFVRGYEALQPRERQVVLRAVRPFKQHLETLIKQGLTHDILGLEERIGDAPERKQLRAGLTMDGRWMPAVRGKGGPHAATGLEFILSATELRGDTFAHEFAHQVHRFAFTPEQKRLLHALYLDAMVNGRPLGTYARTDEQEYFAVAYEAFVTIVRSPWSSGAYTRAVLEERDPKLYAFLLEATEIPDPDPALARLRDPVLAFYEWAGHPEHLRLARTLFEEPAASR